MAGADPGSVTVAAIRAGAALGERGKGSTVAEWREVGGQRTKGPADPGAGSEGGRRRHRPLGAVLLEKGLVSAEQLASAVERQRRTGEMLGAVLTGTGLVSEEDLARALAEHLGYPFVEGDLPIDAAAVAAVPEAVARHCRALPLAIQGRELTVAMADPGNPHHMDDLRYASRLSIRPVITTPRALERAFARVYAPGPRPRDGAEGDESAALEAPVIRIVDGLLARAVADRASDVHVEPGEKEARVRFRVDGALYVHQSLPMAQHPAVLARIKVISGLDISERRLPQDGRFRTRVGERPVDVRVSTLPTIFGEAAVLRLLDKSALATTPEGLGFAPEAVAALRRLVEAPYGMVLVAGPTGSGKTTTLMTALAQIDAVRRNVTTVEDPVEYELPGVNHVQVNPRAGLTFAEGLRALLRQDPDVVVVGEVRDGETADIAVRAALTGHLLLSTIHTNSAAGTAPRLLDIGGEPYLVASALVGVVGQRLARRLCPRCATREPAGADEAVRCHGLLEAGESVGRAGGCSFCDRTGYRGRIALTEVLALDAPLRRLILQRAPASALHEAAVSGGMRPLFADGLAKARAGLTTLEEVMRAAWSED